MKKILITSIGTLGDINPAISLAKLLKKSGIQVGFATCERYRPNVEAAGIKCHIVRPNYDPKDPALCQAIMDPLKTLLHVHKLILTKEQIDLSINDFDTLLNDYDIIIGNVFSYPAKIACLKNNKKWISLNLSPVCFFSAFDPPELYPLTFFNRFKIFGPWFFGTLFPNLFRLVDFWGKNIHEAYNKRSLPKAGNLLLKAPFSTELNLALFPESFASVQRDWPENTKPLGFLFYSGEKEHEICPDLEKFLQHSEKPILFTFGSTAIYNLDKYIDHILKVTKKLNQRVIITVGKNDLEKFKHLNDELHYFCDFLPYTTTMHKMKLVIHQGGIGTVSTCLKAGVPQVILPYCTDQFDNAARVKKLGTGLSIPLNRLNEKKLFTTVKSILDDKRYFEIASDYAKELKKEDPEKRIVEAILKV